MDNTEIKKADTFTLGGKEFTPVLSLVQENFHWIW